MLVMHYIFFYYSGLSLRKQQPKDYLLVLYQKKSRFHMELMDSKVQTTKDIIKENKCFRVYNRDETLIKIGS
jgi:hypothetical protein